MVTAAGGAWQSEILEEFRREGLNPPGPFSIFIWNSQAIRKKVYCFVVGIFGF